MNKVAILRRAAPKLLLLLAQALLSPLVLVAVAAVAVVAEVEVAAAQVLVLLGVPLLLANLQHPPLLLE